MTKTWKQLTYLDPKTKIILSVEKNLSGDPMGLGKV